MNEGFDSAIKQRLDEQLAQLPDPHSRVARPRRRAAGVLAAALVAALALSSAGFASQVNAAADQEGLGCADLPTKVQFWVARLDGEKVTIPLPPEAGQAFSGTFTKGVPADAKLIEGKTITGAHGTVVFSSAPDDVTVWTGSVGASGVSGTPVNGDVTVTLTKIDPALFDKFVSVKATCVIGFPPTHAAPVGR